MAKVDTMKVQITGGVTGRPHYLAYSAGQIVDLPKERAKLLIDEGLAKAYESEGSKKPKTGTVERAISTKTKKATKR